MASILKHGDGWRVFVHTRGVRGTQVFRTKAQAQAWASKREAEIDAGAAGKLVAETVRGALRKYAAEVSPTKKGARWEKVRNEDRA